MRQNFFQRILTSLKGFQIFILLRIFGPLFDDQDFEDSDPELSDYSINHPLEIKEPQLSKTSQPHFRKKRPPVLYPTLNSNQQASSTSPADYPS
ncbi:MAG: hypothetical protein AAF623_17020 [Planctomycetota bacterium]